MLSRRQFLVQGTCSLGAWLVGAPLARLICRLAEENREPYLVEVERPQHVLWATWVGDEYLFSLDCAYTDMGEPELTWRQWLERKDVDVSKEKDIREFLQDSGWYRPGEGESYVAPDLDTRLPEPLLQRYLDGEYTMYDAPTARAYHYLGGLELADRRGRGEGLGALKFVDSPCPGNNASLVSTESVTLLGGLQQRLLQLGQRVRIITDSL